MKRHEREFLNAMEEVNKNGFVRTASSLIAIPIIYRFDFNKELFVKVSTSDLMNCFNRIYLNSYNHEYTLEDVVNKLNLIDLAKVENFYKVNEAFKSNLNIYELAEEINPLIEMNDNLKNEIEVPVRWSYDLQLQALININIFTDGTKFYRYSNRNFKPILIRDIINYIPDSLKKSNPEDILVENKLILNKKKFLKDLVNINDLGIKLNKFYNFKRYITNFQNDYTEIVALIKTFEYGVNDGR